MTRNLEGEDNFVTPTNLAFGYVYDKKGEVKNAPWPIDDIGLLLVRDLMVLRRNNSNGKS